MDSEEIKLLLARLSPHERAELDALILASSNNDDLQITDLRIQDKEQRITPFTLNPAQRDLLPKIAKAGGRHLILKARQLGMSTLVQAHLFLTAIQRTARIGTLAHDDATTQKLRDMAQLFFDQLEHKPPRAINNATKTHYPATHSTVYIATAGNRSAGRGGTYSHVHGSEVAFWKDAAYLLAGLMQGVPTDGEIILESTPNGQQGWFYEQCMKALDGNSEWQLHFYPWWWEPGYRRATEPLTLTDEEHVLASVHGLDDAQIAWRRAKVSELGILFAQEYPEDAYSAFIASGQGYFDISQTAFDAAQDTVPVFGHRYVAGLDFGQSNDYTVLSVLDATDARQVDILRVNRQSWADMRRAIADTCKRWGVSVVLAEANSMGSTNIEALRSEFDALNIDTTIASFQTTHTTKATLIADLNAALPGLRLLAHGEQKAELRAFASKQTATGAWTFGAPDGMHDDTVIALALAWRAVAQVRSIQDWDMVST